MFAAVNCCGTSLELTSNTAKPAHSHYGHRPAAFQLGRVLTQLAASRIDHEIHEHRQSGTTDSLSLSLSFSRLASPLLASYGRLSLARSLRARRYLPIMAIRSTKSSGGKRNYLYLMQDTLRIKMLPVNHKCHIPRSGRSDSTFVK